jgi:CRP-like cAMP-binding protein
MLVHRMAETFLDALTEEETGDLESVGRRRSYGSNVTLFHEGDDAGPVVVLLAGRVKLATIGGARGDHGRARPG